MTLTIDEHTRIERYYGVRLRVLVDGEDVTNDCQSADDKYGWALVLLRDPHDHRFVDYDGNVAKRVVLGHVQFVPEIVAWTRKSLAAPRLTTASGLDKV